MRQINQYLAPYVKSDLELALDHLGKLRIARIAHPESVDLAARYAEAERDVNILQAEEERLSKLRGAGLPAVRIEKEPLRQQWHGCVPYSQPPKPQRIRQILDHGQATDLD